MSKLMQLTGYLKIEQAIERLSKALADEVNEADIFYPPHSKRTAAHRLPDIT